MKRRTMVVTAAAIALAAPSTALANGAVRVLHASPNAPAVDVWVNGAKAVSQLRAGAITGYLSLPAGRYGYAIRVAGAPRSAHPVAAGAFRLRDGHAFTIAATGFVEHLRVRAIRDVTQRPFGVARIRVIHLSPDAPKVDVVLKGGGKVVSALAFPRTSGYLTVPAGRYTFYVRPAGASKPNVIVVRARLVAGNDYTAWALGSLAGGKGVLSLRGVATLDKLPRSFDRTQVRVLHAVPDAPPVDVYLGTKKAISGLAFGDAAPATGAYLRLPSGPVTVSLRPAGAAPTSAPVLSKTLTLPAQATLTVAAAGELMGSGPLAIGFVPFADNVSPLAKGKARATVVHLSPGTPAVDVFAGTAKIVSGLAFPNAAAALTVPAGAYSFSVGIAPATSGSIPVPAATLKPGTATTVYAIGLAGGSPALRFKALQVAVP